MADASTTLAQDTANLHLDEVTGEKVSKSELKKRQKQRQLEEKKKEKAAAAPPKAEKKSTNAEMDESNLNPNVSIPLPHFEFTTDSLYSNTSRSEVAESTDYERPRILTRTRTSSTSTPI